MRCSWDEVELWATFLQRHKSLRFRAGRDQDLGVCCRLWPFVMAKTILRVPHIPRAIPAKLAPGWYLYWNGVERVWLTVSTDGVGASPPLYQPGWVTDHASSAGLCGLVPLSGPLVLGQRWGAGIGILALQSLRWTLSFMLHMPSWACKDTLAVLDRWW